MSKPKLCKIKFYTLIVEHWKNSSTDVKSEPFVNIKELIESIIKIRKKKERFQDLKEDRFCFLDNATISENNGTTLISGLFKSARNEFKPNIINKQTGEERKNPKSLSEGDVHKTHFCIKIDSNEVYLLLESNYFGIHINNIIGYFAKFYKILLVSQGKSTRLSLNHLVIPQDDFFESLQTLEKTKIAEVYFDKQLLGSRALKFSNRTVSLKNEIKLTLTAQPHESIKEVAIDLFNNLNSEQGGSDITKIRIYGNNPDGNPVVLDTTFMTRMDHVEVDLNTETGEVNSTQLLSGMSKIAISI
ncbi:hypothetical protein [Cellulophaga sp. BC115SP]|uniref:hypothetical protein n=1 Tax=Cellulophaga sp. BC115SP TaxID=2683263 RepID=UPI0014121787|nr:hypothetical protein [Cellulophaga sp. BC115SP]NBB31982.1 hypothetical protein [Cellulophaga sp. BC115SP]